jgi:hypothetical protein
MVALTHEGSLYVPLVVNVTVKPCITPNWIMKVLSKGYIVKAQVVK